MNYSVDYKRSMEQPVDFWREQAQKLAWHSFPNEILQTDSDSYGTWFSDGTLNMAELCLDVHEKQGRGNQVALYYDSPVTNTKKAYTYSELRKQVARIAGAMKRSGLQKGDTALLYMPMVPEAVMCMLACARIGVTHSVVFGGFAPHELTVRIDDAKPKIIFTASCGIEVDKVIPYKVNVDKAIEAASYKPEQIVLLHREQFTEYSLTESYHDFRAWLEGAEEVEPIAVESTHPLYILYTSGTTGKPKGIVRDTGGYATALKYSMDAIYNMHAGDVFWALSDLGWAVGHSYIVYAPLIQGCSTVLYEGKPIRTPNAGAMWRVAKEYGVKTLFAAPTALRAIRKEDSDASFLKQYEPLALQHFFVAGERCDPATYHWTHEKLGVPVIDHWWQTESGWPMVAVSTSYGTAQPKAGSAGLPVCGYRVEILSEEGHVLDKNENGYICVKLPLPPGCFPSLWNDKTRFREEYLRVHPGYYFTGDGGYIDEDGYIYIMGRVDDVINVAGHRLSTGEMEEIITAHPQVAECAVIGIADDLRGQVPIGLVVLKENLAHVSHNQIEQELVELIRNQIGAVAVFKKALIVQRLPKTRSGKIVRKTLRKMADGESFAIPSTIEDPTVLDEIADIFKLELPKQ